MRITNNYKNKINYSGNKKTSFNAQKSSTNNANLPSAYSLGTSLINSNVPVSYMQIGEIEIPGLKDKARVYKLSNGQKVIIAKKQGPTMIKTAYNVGSMNETDDIRGISHFIEHNLFNGSKELAPQEYDKKLSDMGGSTNANTSFAITNYYLKLQLLNDNSLEEAIKLNSQLSQFPTFLNEQLEKEKEPVKSEIDMYKDMPGDVSHNQVLKDLFGIKTTSTDFIIGTKDNINSLTREKVIDYYDTWYTPDNAITVITGDVDFDETIALVSKHYNKKNDYANINKRYYEPIKYNEKPIRRDFISPNATATHISMGFAIPENTSKSDIEKIDMVLDILSAPNSNLSKRMDKLGIKVSFEEEKMQNRPNSAIAKTIEIDTPEQKTEEALKIIYEEITNISNFLPSIQNLENIKNKKINEINAISESSEGINNALSNAALNNDFDYWNNKTKNIRAITPNDVSLAARTFFDLNKTAICVAHEKTTQGVQIGSEMQKTLSFGKAINPAQIIDDETKTIQEFRLPNNIETMLIQGNPYAKTSASIHFKSDDLNGVSNEAFNILTRLLNRGSNITNKETFDEIQLQKDINIGFHANNEGLFVVSSAYDNNLKDSLALIKEVITNPNFSQKDFEAEKQKVYDEIMSEQISALDKVQEEFFKDTRKYASKEQRLKELELLTLDDIKNLYSLIMSTAKVNATMAAGINEKPYLKDIFNNELSTGLGIYRPYTKTKSPSYYSYSPNTTAKTIVQADEVKQANVIQAYKFRKSENIADIAKIEALNTILGNGGMSSRLFTDLRNTQKLAYLVHSYTIDNHDTGVIVLDISTSTESSDGKEGSPENITKSIEGFNRNVNLLKTQNISQEELDKVKIRLKTSILNHIEQNGDKNIQYSISKESVYDIKFQQELFKAIDALTTDDIRAAANYVFNNPPLTSIVASQNTLKALNLQ